MLHTVPCSVLGHTMRTDLSPNEAVVIPAPSSRQRLSNDFWLLIVPLTVGWFPGRIQLVAELGSRCQCCSGLLRFIIFFHIFLLEILQSIQRWETRSEPYSNYPKRFFLRYLTSCSLKTARTFFSSSVLRFPTRSMCRTSLRNMSRSCFQCGSF